MTGSRSHRRKSMKTSPELSDGLRRGFSSKWRPRISSCLGLLLCFTAATPGALSQPPRETSASLELSRTVRPWEFLPGTGTRAALFGNEGGKIESWVYPLKIIRESHFNFLTDEQVLPAEALARTLTVIPDPLCRIAGKLLPPRRNRKRQRRETHRHRRFDGRPRRRAENVSAPYGGLLCTAARSREVLPGLSRPHRQPRTAGRAAPAGLRLGAHQRVPGPRHQSLSRHRPRRRLSHFRREPAPGLRVVFRPRFLLDFACAERFRRFFHCAHRARLHQQIPARRRQNPARNFARREFRGLVQGLSLSLRFRRRHAAVHHRDE